MASQGSTSQGSKRRVVGILGGTLLLGMGCAHDAPPPRELADARAEYARAAAGPARDQDSARLRLAKEALDRAEADYRNAGDDQVVRSEAYVALRRAQAAEAAADAALASQRRTAALNQLATLQGIHAEHARQQLAAEKARAAQEGARADVASEQASAAQQQAEREREDRIAAGARADVATQQAAQEQARAQVGPATGRPRTSGSSGRRGARAAGHQRSLARGQRSP